MESSQNAPRGHFGFKLECTEGPFWLIHRAVWAEGPFGLDNISWSDVIYSRVPNKRVGGNKHVGRKNLQNVINM